MHQHIIPQEVKEAYYYDYMSGAVGDTELVDRSTGEPACGGVNSTVGMGVITPVFAASVYLQALAMIQVVRRVGETEFFVDIEHPLLLPRNTWSLYDPRPTESSLCWNPLSP